MDLLRKVEIEAKKIQSIITGYTSRAPIHTNLELLLEAINKGDKDEILYHFKDLEKWYKQNLPKINQNEYVFDFSEHQDAMISITQIIEELKIFKDPLTTRNVPENKELMKKIFISHSNRDREIVDLFVNEIEKINEEIVYTSQPSKNPSISGEDFIDKIFNGIKESGQIIACLSPNFYESIVCQVEMGMAYALGKQIKPIIITRLPKYKENLQGVFHSNTKADHLYSEDQLLAFFETLGGETNASTLLQYVKNIHGFLPD